MFHYSNIPLFRGFVVFVMAKIEIDQERCKGCGLCTIACPKALIRIGEEINRQGYFFAVCDDHETCTGCAICGEICPDVAIQVWR
jgi:2-oxoglutarate ferredoxin oxidoreductase subunit delta